MPKISCIASFSPHFLFLFRTRCFLASSPLALFFLSICCFVTFRKCLRPERSSASSCSCSTCTRNEMPEGSKFKRQPEKGQCDGRQGRAGQGGAVAARGVAWRGVAESSRVFTAMCIVCKSARPSRHLQEWPTMSLRASLHPFAPPRGVSLRHGH